MWISVETFAALIAAVAGRSPVRVVRRRGRWHALLPDGEGGGR